MIILGWFETNQNGFETNQNGFETKQNRSEASPMIYQMFQIPGGSQTHQGFL